jgi:hypothetical protein
MWIFLAAMAASIAMVSPAQGQALPHGVDAQLVHPSPFGSAVLGLDAADVGNTGLTVGLFTTYLRKPVEINGPATENRPSATIRDAIGAELTAALHTNDRLEIGVALPFTLFQNGERDDGDGDTDLSSSAMGDIRIGFRMDVYRRRALEMAVIATVTTPTGNDRAYAGSGAFTTEPRIMLGVRDRRGGAALSGGIRVRESARLAGGIDIGTAGVAHASMHLHVASGLDVVGGAMALIGGSRRESPIEGIAGIRYRMRCWELSVGAGAGLNDGVSDTVGRVLVGVRYAVDRARPRPSGQASPRTR